MKLPHLDEVLESEICWLQRHYTLDHNKRWTLPITHTKVLLV